MAMTGLLRDVQDLRQRERPRVRLDAEAVRSQIMEMAVGATMAALLACDDLYGDDVTTRPILTEVRRQIDDIGARTAPPLSDAERDALVGEMARLRLVWTDELGRSDGYPVLLLATLAACDLGLANDAYQRGAAASVIHAYARSARATALVGLKIYTRTITGRKLRLA